MSLMLVACERRRREFQVRAAIGASRGQIVRLIVGELAAPAIIGTTGGLLLASWTLDALPALRLPGGIELSRLDLSLDWRVLGMALTTTVVTLFAAASVALVRFSRTEIAVDLAGGRVGYLRSTHGLRQWLLGAHVFVTSVVLIIAGLFIRSVESAFDTGAGFDVDRTVFVDVQLMPPVFGRVSNALELQAAYESRRLRFEDGLRALPGIREVASGSPPLGPAASLLVTRTFETDSARRDVSIGVLSGSAELARALGLTLLQGRHLQLEDRGSRPNRIVITQNLARLLWPGGDPLGKMVTQTMGSRGGGQSVVVGVIADLAYESISRPVDGVIVSVSPFPNQPRYVVLADQPDATGVAIAQLVSRTASDAPLLRITTGRQLVTDDMGRQRLGAWFLSGSGVVSLLLGAGGVFALVAYLADTRRREYGVRIALGGSVASVTRLAAVAGVAPSLVGAVAGLACAFGLAGVVGSLLPGVGRFDLSIYLVVSALLIAAAALASVAGAGRLRTLSPAEVLRSE
jgi:putative ABC transport system permease protein